MRQALRGLPRRRVRRHVGAFDGRNGGIAELVVDPRDGKAKPVRQSDGFHLNADGAEILAIDIAAQVETILEDLGADVCSWRALHERTSDAAAAHAARCRLSGQALAVPRAR